MMVGPFGLTEHTSTFDRRAVLAFVAEHAPRGASVAEIEGGADRLFAHASVVQLTEPKPERIGDDVDQCTTVDLLAVEQHLLHLADAGRHARVAVAPAGAVTTAVAARPTLSTEQETMIRVLATGGAAVAVVVGRAGAGKTFALDAARHAWQLAGIPVVGAALSARAAAELEAGSGIRSMTVARLLGEAERPGPEGGLTPGGVVVVDEAAMVGSRHLDRLLTLAASTHTKVVLVADHHQVPEIAAGGAFAALARRLDAVELAADHRQQHAWERDTLAELRAGSVHDAVDRYDAEGRITVADTARAARAAMVADWAAARADGSDTVMFALRRVDVTDLNDWARAWRRGTGQLGDEEIELRGRPFAVGDEVMATRNRWRAGLVNGARATVVAIDTTGGRIGLRQADGTRVDVSAADAERARLDHAYAMTIHKAQGATVDRALLLGSDQLYREAGYVGMSRARQRSDFYIVAGDTLRAEIAHGPEPRPDQPVEQLVHDLSMSRAQTLATDTAAPTLAALTAEHDRLAVTVIAATPPDPAGRLAELDAQLARVATTGTSWAERDRTHLAADREALVAAVAARQRWLEAHAGDLARFQQLEQMIGERHRQIEKDVVSKRPAHVVALLGPIPARAARPARDAWVVAAARLEAYRERWQIIGADPLGPRPDDIEQRLERERVERELADAARRLGRMLDRGRGIER